MSEPTDNDREIASEFLAELDGGMWRNEPTVTERLSATDYATWTHSWWCSGDMSDCRFNGCKPPNSGVGGTQ